MNTATQSVADTAHAAGLHARVQRARHSLPVRDWGHYLGTLQQLPALLRENGLAQTLGFLALQASAKPGVARLLADWLGPDQGEGGLAGLCESKYATGLKLLRDVRGPHYTHASRLAMGEVKRLLRSATALDGAPPADPPSSSSAAAIPALADRRDVFGRQRLGPDGRQHPGLVWRFAGLPNAPASGASPAGHYKADHIAEVIELTSKHWSDTVHAQFYKRAFQRWQAWVHTRASHCEAKVAGRLQLGSGSPTVFETQVLLHPVHGMPYLPGSTLKGALRAHLDARIKARSPALPAAGDVDAEKENAATLAQMMSTLFGEQCNDGPGNAGALTILDAWWIPGSGKPLVREVETPHHSDYYAGRTSVASAFDSPIPVAQLATEGRFLLAIAHARVGQAWAQEALDWLLAALGDPTMGGLGSKAFSAGGGRLHRIAPATQPGP